MIKKNIQIIDGADNALYLIYSVSEEDFNLIFPNKQDVEFADEFVSRLGKKKATVVLKHLWKNEVDKKSVQGIHGTLFFDAEFNDKINRKKQYYPNKKESEVFLPYLQKISVPGNQK